MILGVIAHILAILEKRKKVEDNGLRKDADNVVANATIRALKGLKLEKSSI